MPLPASVPTITVAGTFYRQTGLLAGTPAAGTITFAAPQLRVAADNIILPKQNFTATLDANGSFSVVLLTTTPGYYVGSPNWAYSVTATLTDATFTSNDYQFPEGFAPTVDLADVSPVTDPADCDLVTCANQEEIAVLQGEIEQEIEDRIAADDALQANIDAEEAARIAADAVLQAEIDAIQGGDVTSIIAGDGIDVSGPTGNVTISAEFGTGPTQVAPGDAPAAAEAAAIAAAATDATTKANAAQAAAIAAAATDATTKANAAQAAAIAAAATDATTKANAAQAAAIAAAAADATAKANAAQAASQPLDSDLTAIAALDSTQSGAIASDGAGWVQKTYPQFKTALGLVKADVGLGNVDNTSDANKPISTATQTALNAKQDLDADLTAIAGLTPTNDDILQRKAGAWTNRSMAQLGADVQSSLTVTESQVTGLVADLAGKQPLDADLTTIAGLTATTDNTIMSVGSAWASRTPAQVKTTLALNNVDNTSDASKPISTATQTALDGKASTAHASTHLPGGTDALTTAIAGSSAVGDTAATGTALSFSRSDHRHGRESFGAVTAQTTFGAASANGTATTLPRSDHVHGTPTHDGTAHSAVSISSLAAPTGSVAWGSQKITSLANGTAATDAAAFGQIIPASLVDAKGDLIVGTADNTVARLAVGSNLKVLMPASDQTAGVEWFDLLGMLGYLSAEQESLLRTQAWSDSLNQTTGNVTLAYWTARRSETITAIRAVTGSTAAGATPTLCKMGIYSVAGNGDLTRVAQITSDTSLFAGTYTSYQRNLAASVSVTRGNRYASALLVVTGATAPKMRGYAGMPGNDGGAAPRLNGIISGQTDLSSSYTSASVANTDGVPYVVAVP